MIKSALFVSFCLIGANFQAAQASPQSVTSKDPANLLQEADRLAWLKDWTRSEPLFRAAEGGFQARHDQRNALYAKIGEIRGQLPGLALLPVSTQLESYLNLPLVQDDARLKLRCLTVKGDVDMDVDTDLATDDWEQARAVAEQLGDKQWIARANGELGILAFLRGDSSQALKLVYGAMQSAKASGDVGAEIRYLTLLGRGLGEFGNYDQGLKLIDQAIALVAAQPDLKYPMLQWSNKVDLLQRMGRSEEAEALIRKGVTIIRKDGYKGYDADLNISLASIYMGRKDFKGAVPILLAARQTAREVDGLRLVAEANLALSQCYEKLKDFTRARAASADGVKVSRRLGDKSQLPTQLGQLARVEAELDQVREAETTYQESEDVIQGLLISASSPSTRASLLGTLSDVYLGHFHLEAYQRHNTARAFSVIEEVRGRSTADALSNGSKVDATPETRRIWHEIGRLQFRLMQTSNRQNRRDLLDQIFEQEQSLGPAESIHSKPERFGGRVQLAKLQRVLGKQEAVVEYVLDEPRSSALLITKERTMMVSLPGSSKIGVLSKRLLDHIQTNGGFGTDVDELSADLLEPLHLESAIHSLVIVPDGVLHNIPFAVLRRGGESPLKTMSISYVPSSTVLAMLRQQLGSDSRQILAISGAAPKSGPPALLASGTIRGVYDVDSAKLSPLIAADDEVESVAEVSGLKPTILHGADADEARFKNLRPADYDVIHFAVHGVVSTKYPDRSALLLQPSSDGAEDGLLQAREIRQLHLNADLVTLSACNSSLGKLKGEEGVANLVQAFLVAGARSVVANLWAVNDEFSRDFMTRFYRELAKGETVAEALRQAKLNVIHDYGTAEPNLWAGYVVYGDGSRKIQ